MINRNRADNRSLIAIFVLSAVTAMMISGCFFVEKMDKGDNIKQLTYPEADIENWLYSVWGSSATDVWAVGQHGAVLHYNGSEWKLQQLDVKALSDVWGTAANDVYTCGSGGAIFNYNGTSWSKMTSGTNEHLRAIGIGPYEDIYACGDNGTIRLKSGTTWSGAGEYAYRFSSHGEPIDTLDFYFDMDGFSTISPYCVAGDSARIVMENNRPDSPYLWTWGTSEDKYFSHIRCSIGNTNEIEKNFMANARGSILCLGVDGTGALSWMYPRSLQSYACRPITTPAPITGIWLDPRDDKTIYLTTEWGNIATFGSDCSGTTQVYQHDTWLSDIWGPDDGSGMFVVGRFGVILYSGDGVTWQEMENVPLPE